ncbi:hypothetical protein IEQ34_012039 [Dendrobium chrysotoxum]|uniref:Uncharacterized protein n=1 Tax=Dendrobium chrysotoxum TaxID=161865 RepID=A0AAV7GBU3_DENCH|nr:hypothetical protein IEQ34_012039 [Dendrobium chrysotoxum]
MEDLPSYCSHCKSLGHSKLECHILHPQLVTHTNVGTELVNNGNKILLIVNPVDIVSNDPLLTGGEGLSVKPSTDVLHDPFEQVVNRTDVSLTVALSLAHSCGNNEDKVMACEAHSYGINEDVVKVCVHNNCLLNLASNPLVPPDSNVYVNDGETALPDDSTPLPGDRACVSSTGGFSPSNCSKGAESLVTPPRFSVSLPKSVDPMVENLGSPLVEVPIFVLSKDALIAHLTDAAWFSVSDYVGLVVFLLAIFLDNDEEASVRYLLPLHDGNLGGLSSLRFG